MCVCVCFKEQLSVERCHIERCFFYMEYVGHKLEWPFDDLHAEMSPKGTALFLLANPPKQL